MLRKTFHIVFSVFLLISTAGISISMHYCGGKLVSASLNKEAKSCCDGVGGCCENKTFQFKINDDFVSPVVFENPENVKLDILFPIIFVYRFASLNEGNRAFRVFMDSSPPPTIQTRLALMQTYLC